MQPDRPRVLSGGETLMATGEPIGIGSFPCLLEPEFLSLSPFEQRKVSGNAVETTFYVHFLTYVLSNLELIKGDSPLLSEAGPSYEGSSVEVIDSD